jgi:hypothetical protein
MAFNGVDVLLAPSQYLSGPCFSFEKDGVRHLLRNEEEGPRLKILVWRQGPATHLYTFKYIVGEVGKTNESVLFFCDIFTFFQPYLIAFLTVRNTTPKPLKDLTLQFLLEFAVGGVQHYDVNYGEYHAEDKVITQTADKYPTMGFGSPVRPSHWQTSPASELRPTQSRLHLNDQMKWGPGDCAVGLEWDFPGIKPGQDGFTPIIIAGGKNYREFLTNYWKGVARAKRITRRVFYSIQHPSRITGLKKTDQLPEKG